MKNNKNNHSPLLLDTSQIVLTKSHRCQACNKLLGVEHLIVPSFDIKCLRCGRVNSIVKESERQIIITDRDGTILYVNDQVCKVTGYESEELLGRTPAIWGSQMTREFYKDMWNQIAIQKKAVVFKVTNKHKNGNLYPVILRISPILDIDGNVELFMGIETIPEALEGQSYSNNTK